MSVLNRKMFKPRNARNALNRSAGIPTVARFHAGGPVGHTHRTFPGLPRTGPGPVILNKQLPTMTPNVASGVATALRPDQLRRLGQERMRTSLFGQRPSQSLKLSGGISGSVGQGVPVTELDKLTQKAKVGAGQALDVGMSAVQAPINVGFDMGTNLAEKGTQLTPEFGQQVISGQAQLSKQQLAGINAGLIKLPNNLVQALESGELPLIPGLDMTRVDPNLDPGARMMKELPGEQTFRISKPGDAPKETSEQMMARIATEDAGMQTDDDSIQNLLKASRILSDESRMQQGQVPADGDVLVETESFDIDTDDQDPVRPKSAADPKEPGPKNLSEEQKRILEEESRMQQGQKNVVAQARASNAEAGIPTQDSGKQEVKTAMERGTGSPEDIKAEFLKLLPKYEEDPSIQGLNLAMMGFAIAGGDSPNALKNIADGMKKTLPAFIKSAQKRKAFEREADLLASKYTIQRMEGDRTRGLTENTYFATAAFDNPITGEKVEAGQIFRLNDKAFKLAEQQGLTKYLTTPNLQAQTIAAQGKVDAAKIKEAGGGLDDYYEKSVFVEVPGLDQKIRVRYPTAQGEALGLQARPAAGKGGWDKFTQGYVGQLDRIVFADQGVQAAIDLADQGEALGVSGAIGRLTDATKQLIPEKYGKRLGIDYNTLSDGGEYEVLNRNLALQLAPIILNEGGKTISNQDRALVAQALGYNIDANGNILFGGGLVNIFKSKEEAMTALKSIQGILRKNASNLHSVYQSQANEFGYTMATVDERRKAATSSANTAQTGGLRWQADDDGVLNLVGS